MAKISRKQLKEDKLLSTTAKVSIFLGEYWKQIVGAVVIVVVLVGAIILYSSYITGRNERAGRDFVEALVGQVDVNDAVGFGNGIEVTHAGVIGQVLGAAQCVAEMQGQDEAGGDDADDQAARLRFGKCREHVGRSAFRPRTARKARSSHVSRAARVAGSYAPFS